MVFMTLKRPLRDRCSIVRAFRGREIWYLLPVDFWRWLLLSKDLRQTLQNLERSNALSGGQRTWVKSEGDFETWASAELQGAVPHRWKMSSNEQDSQLAPAYAWYTNCCLEQRSLGPFYCENSPCRAWTPLIMYSFARPSHIAKGKGCHL